MTTAADRPAQVAAVGDALQEVRVDQVVQFGRRLVRAGQELAQRQAAEGLFAHGTSEGWRGPSVLGVGRVFAGNGRSAGIFVICSIPLSEEKRYGSTGSREAAGLLPPR